MFAVGTGSLLGSLLGVCSERSAGRGLLGEVCSGSLLGEVCSGSLLRICGGLPGGLPGGTRCGVGRSESLKNLLGGSKGQFAVLLKLRACRERGGNGGNGQFAVLLGACFPVPKFQGELALYALPCESHAPGTSGMLSRSKAQRESSW